MKTEYTYLLINILTILFPLLFTFHKKIQFYHEWKFIFPAILVTAIPFIIWDMIFTNKGVWYFNNDRVTGIHVYNLPVEEILFFITIPYSSLFLYEAVKRNVKANFLKGKEKILIYILQFYLLLTLIILHDKLYTFYSFLFLFLFLSLFQCYRFPFINNAFLSYAILLLPFMIVNGTLTGMFIQNPVVMYNNNENMGTRILTIPVEDIFYGLLLFLMNVSFYELFKKTLNHGK